MKQQAKVVLIPQTATAAQMESALNNHLNAGWKLISIFNLGTNTFAILVRIVAG